MRSEWARLSEQQILEEFIPIYDNFKKAFNIENIIDDKSFENWKKGIEHIMNQFKIVLKKYNVEEIKTVGEKFNPELHEAVGEEESNEQTENLVIREVDSGYTMKDKVIKPAKVILVK